MTKERILRLDEVRHRCSLHRATIYKRMGEGTFPQRVSLGGAAVGWYESDIDAWVADPAGYRQQPKAA